MADPRERDKDPVSQQESLLVRGHPQMTIVVWDDESREELQRLRHEGFVQCIALSDDGRTIVSGASDTTVRVWNAEGGEEFRPLCWLKTWVDDVTFSTDGSRIISGAREFFFNVARVWDSESVEELLCLPFPYSAPDHPRADHERVGVRVSQDGTVQVWDTDSGTELGYLRGHEGGVTSVAISNDGRRIVSGSHDRTVRVWDAEGTEELLCLRGHQSSVSRVVISKDGRMIASGSLDKTVRIWDSVTGECLEVMEADRNVQAIASGPAFPFQAIARGTETVIENNQGQVLSLFPLNLDGLATHPSGRRWAGTSEHYLYVIALEGLPDQTQI